MPSLPNLLGAVGLLGVAALHLWVYRVAGRTGSLPGRGGWIDRRSNPRAFAIGRGVCVIAAFSLLILAVGALISN